MVNIFKVLITGSRSFDDYDRMLNVFQKIDEKFSHYDMIVLLSGACPTGADRMAENIAESLGWNVERYPADWKKDGKAAGPLRNQRMIDEKPDICVAFPTNASRGTWDCVRRAEKADVFTKVFE